MKLYCIEYADLSRAYFPEMFEALADFQKSDNAVYVFECTIRKPTKAMICEMMTGYGRGCISKEKVIDEKTDSLDDAEGA